VLDDGKVDSDVGGGTIEFVGDADGQFFSEVNVGDEGERCGWRVGYQRGGDDLLGLR